MLTTSHARLPAIALSAALALAGLRIASPALILLAALAVLPLKPTHEVDQHSDVTVVVRATRTPRRGAILALLSLAALTHLADGALFVVRAVTSGNWTPRTGLDVAAPLGLVAYAGLAALGAYKDVTGARVWEARRVHFAVAAALAIEIAHGTLLGFEHTKVRIPELPGFDLAHFALVATRVLVLVPLLGALVNPRVSYVSVLSDESEPATASTSLLHPPGTGAGAEPSTGLSALAAKDASGTYGTFHGRDAHSGPTTRTNTPAPSTKATTSKEDISLDPTWAELRVRLGRIFPYLWPSKSVSLQLVALACFLLLIVGRVVNVFLPFTLANLFESLNTPGKMPWVYLLTYVGLRYLQSSGGLPALRDLLWTPVMQYSDRSMSQLCFDHLLNLSLAFHTRRKTGEVLRILDRGAAINRIFELLLFNLVPIVADIGAALVVFVIYFEWTLALVVAVTMVAYMTASVVLTQWRTKLRRQANDRDVITRGIHTDCLLNYETVKYFNGEQHEAERYADAIRQYQALEYQVITSLNLLNLIQNLIMALGLLVGSMIVALRVTRGQASAPQFVLFITYIAQLYGPLAMLGSLYRSVNQGLVDTERLLKLLAEDTEVRDAPDARPLVVTDGEIVFDNVSFSYDGRAPALSGVSFTVPKGASVALVGESGGGKSTLLRLLYRFYDLGPGQGAIRIDGQDIRNVTQESLRRAIGVVPQDAVLFNASVRYNIAYGRQDASAAEVEAAARAAQMHERIVGFPDGYETKVGERGVRLSGGEKQRVAIARTVLKDPPVLLLDEATSALDTGTERDIQRALTSLVRGRTSLWIAHRLSTIAGADLILVLRDGAVVEQGTHAELLARGGAFAAMWAEQIDSGAGSDGEDEGGDGDGPARRPVLEDDVSGYFVNDPQAHSEVASPSTSSRGHKEALAAAEQILSDSPSMLTEDAAEPSVAEAAEPVEEATAPVEEAAAPAEEAPAPKITEDEPTMTDEPAPIPEEAAPTSEEPVPAAEEPVPAAEEDMNVVAFPTTQSETSLPQPADDSEPTPAPAPAPEVDADKTPAALPVALPIADDAAAPVAFPASDDASVAPVAFPASSDDAPVAFPASDDASVAPIAFPASDDASIAPTVPEREEAASPAPEETPAASPLPSPAPGVTFSPDANPSREGAPDPSEPKRRRISSQNFQRLARRISTSGRRGSQNVIAQILPGLKRSEGSSGGREASEASASGSGAASPAPAETPASVDSPAPSVRMSEDAASPGKLTKKDNKKKDKKEKEKRRTLL